MMLFSICSSFLMLDWHAWSLEYRAFYRIVYVVFAFWMFISGVVLKLPLVRRTTRFAWIKTTVTDLVMNAASSLIYITAVPFVAVMWTISAGWVINRLLAVDYTHPANWVPIAMVTTLAASLADAGVLRLALRHRLPARTFALLSIANVVCMIAALCAAFVYENAHQPEAMISLPLGLTGALPEW